MVKKLFSLHDEVAAQLDLEDNQSALVDVLLGAHYGLTLSNEGKAGNNRAEVASNLDGSDLSFAEVMADPIVHQGPLLAEQIHVPVVSETPEVVDMTPIITMPEPAFEPVVEPIVEPVVEVVPEPVVQIPINVNGQPGGTCETHGIFVGSICIDCL